MKAIKQVEVFLCLCDPNVASAAAPPPRCSEYLKDWPWGVEPLRVVCAVSFSSSSSICIYLSIYLCLEELMVL